MISHAMMMTKHMYYLILLCLGTAVASGVEYIITPSQPQHCVDQCSNNADSVDSSLTLSQFVNNSIDYLTDETTLIFPPGNYSLESEFNIKNLHTFSMIAWPSFSAKVAIVCGNNARFEFRNVSIVTVSGLEFIRCFNNHVVSVGQFQLEDSSFLGHGHAIVSGTKFINNYSNYSAMVNATDAVLVISHCTFTNNNGFVLDVKNTNMSIRYSDFIGNNGYSIMCDGKIAIIDHCKFINNYGSTVLSAYNDNMMSITHSEFIGNAGGYLVYLDGVMITVNLNEFINNRAGTAIVYIANSGSTAPENLTNNVFINNSAAYEVFINPFCRGDHNHSLSLGSSRCITCHEDWHQHLIGIVIAAFIAGIALVIVMLALNITVAVGTLNGILFFANIVAANADTYFSPFETPNIVTVFISWLNLDLGFDVCFFVLEDGATSDPTRVYKALIQLAFPAYVTFLVIIVVVFSECSSKFAKLIGRGNPVAVLATMILLSYSKFINAILSLVSLFYLEPAQGSSNVDVTRINNALNPTFQSKITKVIAAVCFLIVISALILFLCIIYTALVFSWQWLLQYQDKVIFKWVRYQKLRLFLEPYHAPYSANYRYWTGLLLVVRVLLYLISGLNFSLDPRVDLMSTIFVVGGLLLLKGVTAKRVYRNWPLDVIETTIYFNLVAFSALTWYNLDFGQNQAAVAYMSVIIIFILLLAVIVFHILRYTRLYKCSCVEKAFKWTSTKLVEKKPKEEPPNDAPEELDGYQLERTVPGDQELPTCSVIEIRQPTQNQEEQTY